MKKILAFFVIIVSSFALVSCSCSKDRETNSDNGKSEEKELYASIGKEAAVVTVESKQMTSKTEGTATVLIEIPNYTEMFIAANEAGDPEKSLLEAIRRKDYTTVEYTGTATVTVEDGEERVDADEAIEDAIERELIKAVNAVTEEG